jgi:hypothetical protein
MRQLPAEALRSGIQKNATHAPAANQIANVAVVPSDGEFVVLDTIEAGYDIAPTAASPKAVVRFGGDADLTVYVPVKGKRSLRFPRAFYTGVKNESLSVKLDAGGAGVKGTVTITYR